MILLSLFSVGVGCAQDAIDRCVGLSVLALALETSVLPQTTPPTAPSLLTRRYRDGEKLVYHMKATNRDRTSTTAYELDATGIVTKNSAGNFIEEYAWTNLVVDSQVASLTPVAKDFRQVLSLDPAAPPSIPNLSQLRQIIGPITDMLTFYADLWLTTRLNKLTKAGDHFYFAGLANKPNSWADGVHNLVGEDVIAFDITLTEVNASHQVAVLQVRHVPPEHPQIKLPAEWMRPPVADTPNNWVELQKTDAGKYLGLVGKEIFDVQLRVSLTDGKILGAKLDNPVEVLERECADVALTNCGEPVRYQIKRQIEIVLRNQ